LAALLRIAEVAAVFRCSPSQVRRMIASGDLKAARIAGRIVRVDADSVQDLAVTGYQPRERAEAA
jgi:excisionase family DNA binding protein